MRIWRKWQVTERIDFRYLGDEIKKTCQLIEYGFSAWVRNDDIHQKIFVENIEYISQK